MRIIGLIGLVLAFATSAFASPVGKSPYEKVVYISAAVNATQSAAYAGNDYTSPKGFYAGTILQIPANTVIEEEYVIVDTAVVGLTGFKIGVTADDDDGFITDPTPLATVGIQYAVIGWQGAYMKATGNATGGLSGTYKTKKYFSAATNVALAVTGSASAGKIKYVLKGYTLN
jgi:hypothetical protein